MTDEEWKTYQEYQVRFFGLDATDAKAAADIALQVLIDAFTRGDDE
jgi:hypothetical protein